MLETQNRKLNKIARLKMQIITWILSDDPRDLVVLSPTKYHAKQMEQEMRSALSTIIPLSPNGIVLGDGRKIKFEFLEKTEMTT